MDADKRQELMQESRFNLASLNSLTFDEVIEVAKSDDKQELTLFYAVDGKMQDCLVTNVTVDSTSGSELQFITFDTKDVIASSAAFVKPTYGEVWFLVTNK